MTGKRRLLSREERQASILHAASRAFAAGGFAATSMEDIAEEAGITKLIVYRHFDSKQHLYESVLDRTQEHLGEAVGFWQQRLGTDMLRPLVAAARAEPEAFALLFRHAAREPQFARYAAAFTDTATDATERFLEPQVADRTVRRWLARLVLILTIEGILGWLEVGDPGGDDALADRLRAIVAATVEAAVPIEQPPG